MEEREVGRKFFFAMSESRLYDATIKLTVPYYDLIHKTLIDVLNYHFGVIYGADRNSVEGVFLDVGAGTGKESVSILKAFPRLSVLAVDLAEQMRTEFEDNYGEAFGGRGEPRYSFVVGDILKMDFGPARAGPLKEFKGRKRLAAVSAYCIHHFELAEKKEVYRKMFDFLDGGGIMVNMDLFTYGDEAFRKHAHHFDIEFIRKQFDDPEFPESRQLPHDVRMELKEQWVEHMNKDNILDPVEAHIDALREIGFKRVECIFKYFQQAVLVAVK
jgi:tRNA (cmo5U34)-methyltransferase